MKKRKTTSGPIRDKARTKAKLINAVGKVLQKKGYSQLTPSNVARTAGVDKKLIWLYFGGIDNLIEEYIELKAFWRLNIPNSTINQIVNSKKVDKKIATQLMLDYFEVFNKDNALQKIVHWEMGESKDILRKIADKRETTGEFLFSLIDDEFKTSEVDIRAIIAILIGGIYYLNLHASVNGSKVCGIDINEETDKKRILKTIEQIINNSFENK